MQTEISKVARTFDSKSKPSGYAVIIRHTGLNRLETIRDVSPVLTQERARLRATEWDQLWEHRVREERQKAAKAQEQKLEREARDREQQERTARQIEERERRASIQAEQESKQLSAAEQTQIAQHDLLALTTLLVDGLAVRHQLDWETEKDRKPYGPQKPFSPAAPSTPEPKPDDGIYHPKGDALDRVLASRRRAKEAEALARFSADHQAWQASQDAYTTALRRHDIACQTWSDSEAAYLREQKERNTQIDVERVAYEAGDSAGVRLYCERVLHRSQYPAFLLRDFDLEYNQDSDVLVVDFQLPSISDLPAVKEVTYVKSRDESAQKHATPAEMQRTFESVAYQMALRTMYELFDADAASVISSVVFNGYSSSIDPATGQSINPCILSVQASKGEFVDINLANVDPRTCFRSLKGIAAGRLHTLTPVAPIMRIERSDARFVTGYGVVDSITEGDNLAAMDWEDFEHLIRELFEEEFASGGGEVKITRASRDGGVDAIAFDPDPIRGGKIVIQAKRYTGAVGVSAVRDLYGTVMNEGANKGIIVTTSTYGPDSYDFAKGKPLVLIDGSNLLYLLDKHGHKARIDLQEARRLAAEQ
jgi:restriction system protein